MDDLGNAVFQVRADGIDQTKAKFKELETELIKTESLEKQLHGSTELAAQGFNKLAHAGRGAGMGILQLGYAIDDLQYGISAVVNNIPQIVYMMGGGAGMAGVVGIAAVAISQMVKHWDQFKQTFGDTAAFQAVQGALIQIQEQFEKMKKEKSPLLDIALVGPVTINMLEEMRKKWEGNAEAAKAHADAIKEVEEATKRVQSIHSKEQTERASNFKEALERADPDAIRAQMVTRNMRGRKGPDALKEAEQEADLQLGRGLAGQKVPQGSLPQALKDALIDVETEKSRKQTELAQKDQHEREAAISKEVEARKKETEQLIQDGKENERIMKEAQRKSRIEDLEDQKQAIHEGLRADLEAMPKQHAQILQGAKAAVDLYQTAKDNKANELRKQAADRLRSIDETLKKERRLVLEH
jgi:hypothetical protein